MISETWLINQVSEAIERGFEVEIFSLRHGDSNGVSDKFYEYKMAGHTHYLDMPKNFFWRFLAAVPKVVKILVLNPRALVRALDFRKYGRQALSLQLLFWIEPLVGKKFDLIHCHFGTVAARFVTIKRILRLQEKMVTSFYGQDVSMIFKMKGDKFYDELKKECDAFIVMSDYMKKRVVAKGFDEKKVTVIPIFGIDVNDYPFKEHQINSGEVFEMTTVGRFVEKKGFDDLLRALAIVKQKTTRKFMCNIIGGGELDSKLRDMAKELNVEDVVSFKGFMKIQDIIKYFLNVHLYLQPSKVASDGDQE